MRRHKPEIVRPSWYFVAPSHAVQPSAPSAYTTVVADRLLELTRDERGVIGGCLGGAPVTLCERDSLVLAWLGGGEPSFAVNTFPAGDWTRTRMFHVDLPTRPEVVMRDLVDLEHFRAVHGYVDVRYIEEPRYDGAAFTTKIGFGWVPFVSARPIPAQLSARVDGLGVQRTEVHSMAGQLHSRHLLMPTPRLGKTARVHAAYSVRRGQRLPALQHLKAAGLLGYLYLAFRRDLGRDAQLWTGASDYRPRDTPRLRQFRAWKEGFAA